MKIKAMFAVVVTGFLGVASGAVEPPARQIPEPLKAWESWVTWDDVHKDCPRPYLDSKKPLCSWPSRLDLRVERTQAEFEFSVMVFSEGWIALPGDSRIWPVTVTANALPVPVLARLSLLEGAIVCK